MFSLIFHITYLYNNEQWISNCLNLISVLEKEKENQSLLQPFFYRIKKVVYDNQNYKADFFLETIGKKEIL